MTATEVIGRRTMPEAAMPDVQCMTALRPKGGFQRKIDKLTKRIRLLQQLVGKLEARIRIQDEMIKKFRERESAWTSHPRR